ncbi:uncharacterized protein LOC143599764, partial [Bidens hawaiensis]|uniref:uncharacterized protein LOC143599764 n=1 Tax=Bidens hawaiensis TaxID=980011 RepID=UPI00404B21CD
LLVDNITYLNEVNNSKDPSTIKVRIIRLWENRDFKPPHDLWTMEMVLVDEKGNKMRASMLRKIFLKFGIKVKLNPFAFSFESFADLNASKFEEYQTVDIIGCVTHWKPISYFGNKGPNDVEMTLILKDEFKRAINATLFADYAKEMDAYIKQYLDAYNVVIVLQFGKFGIYKKAPQVSNNYFVSKLFINEDVPAINVFKQRFYLLHLKAGLNMDVRSLPLRKDKISCYPCNYCVHSTSSGVALFACGRCSKALQLKQTPSNDDDLYECLNEGCKRMDLLPISKFRIHIRVQDTSGTISLTLWDRDVFNILNVIAETLVEETKGAETSEQNLFCFMGKTFTWL